MSNTKCLVCHQLTLEQRTDVDERLVEGETFTSILKDYPQLSRHSLARHLKHMGNPTNEAFVAAMRLNRELAKARMEDFAFEPFVVAMRQRLINAVEEGMDIIEVSASAVKDGSMSKKDWQEAVNGHAKLMETLYKISAIDLNSALARVMGEGYKVTGN